MRARLFTTLFIFLINSSLAAAHRGLEGLSSTLMWITQADGDSARIAFVALITTISYLLLIKLPLFHASSGYGRNEPRQGAALIASISMAVILNYFIGSAVENIDISEVANNVILILVTGSVFWFALKSFYARDKSQISSGTITLIIISFCLGVLSSSFFNLSDVLVSGVLADYSLNIANILFVLCFLIGAYVIYDIATSVFQARPRSERASSSQPKKGFFDSLMSKGVKDPLSFFGRTNANSSTNTKSTHDLSSLTKAMDELQKKMNDSDALLKRGGEPLLTKKESIEKKASILLAGIESFDPARTKSDIESLRKEIAELENKVKDFDNSMREHIKSLNSLRYQVQILQKSASNDPLMVEQEVEVQSLVQELERLSSFLDKICNKVLNDLEKVNKLLDGLARKCDSADTQDKQEVIEKETFSIVKTNLQESLKPLNELAFSLKQLIDKDKIVWNKTTVIKQEAKRVAKETQEKANEEQSNKQRENGQESKATNSEENSSSSKNSSISDADRKILDNLKTQIANSTFDDLEELGPLEEYRDALENEELKVNIDKEFMQPIFDLIKREKKKESQNPEDFVKVKNKFYGWLNSL